MLEVVSGLADKSVECGGYSENTMNYFLDFTLKSVAI